MSIPVVRTVAPGVMSVAVSDDAEPHFTWTPAELGEALTAAASDPAARVILLEGGSTYFSAGASAVTEDAVPALFAAMPRMLFSVDIPVIAVAAGHALGGGFAMALCCDLMVLGEESSYGANLVTLGFPPGMGSTVLLAEAVGAPLAREMLLTGRVLQGRDLARTNSPVAHAVLPRAEVRPHALRIAQEIASAPRETVVALKRLLVAPRRASALAAADREHYEQMAMMGEAWNRERMAAPYGRPDEE
jgi:polyketide biosynthesis enoyl-CoA hydratase PksI